jgi:hypothetical protein
MTLRRAGVLLVVAVLAVGLGGSLAGAKRHKRKAHSWGSKISLQHPSANRFKGTVHSGLAACFEGRLVNLFYTDPSGNKAILSVQRTNGKGRWTVDLTQPAYPGVYQAQAAKERTRAHKAPQKCRAARSPIFGL